MNTKRIVLFLYYKEPKICKERLLLLKLYNPHVPIYGIYLGYEENFQVFDNNLSNFLELNFCLINKPEAWKRINRDLVVLDWYNEIGKEIEFDFIHVIDWDLLLFDSLDNVYKDIISNNIGVLLFQKLAPIKNELLYTHTYPWKKEWYQLLENAKTNYNYTGEPNISIIAGLCIPKQFLNDLSKMDSLLHSSLDELRLPLIAQVLRYNLKAINGVGDSDYINFNRESINFDQLRKSLAIKEKSIFFPYKSTLYFFEFFRLIQTIKNGECVKTYKTTKAYYFFNAETRKILVLEKHKQVVNLLFKIDNIRDCLHLLLQIEADTILYLYRYFNNAIKPINNKDVVVNQTEFSPVFEIKINPDSLCNLSCNYCFTDKKLHQLNKDTGLVKKVVDKLILDYRHDLPEQGITYRITSEPFIDINALESLIDYVKRYELEHSKKMFFHFCTNGTILNSKLINIIKKVRKQGDTVHISLDGPQEIHDLNRKDRNNKGTYSKIIRNIKILKSEGFKIAICSVITNKHPYPLEILDHLITLQVDMVLMKPCRSGTVYSFNENTINKLILGYEEYFKRLKKWITVRNSKMLSLIKDDFGTRFLKYIIRGNVRLKRCGWSTRSIAIDGKGDYYPCDSFIGLENFKIGNIETGFDYRPLETNVNVTTRSGCNKCWAKFICGGTCYWDSYQSKRNILEIYEPECLLNKYLIGKSLELICDSIELGIELEYLEEIFDIEPNKNKLILKI